MNTSTNLSGHWDDYWKNVGDAGALAVGGAAHPAFQSFWTNVFNSFLTSRPAATVVDLASGSGALVGFLQETGTASLDKVTCVDISGAAIDAVAQRYPGVTGVVSSAADTPFDDHMFDLVISQFGVEYAGAEAVSEAARLTADSGRLTLLMHAADGVPVRESQAGVDAISRVRDARFLELAREFLSAGFDAVQGKDRKPYDDAATALNPAIQAVDAVLQDYGESVAGGTIVNIYDTVQKVHQRIQHYKPEEVFAWFDAMQQGLEHQFDGMQSTLGVALDPAEFQAVGERIVAAGLSVDQAGPVMVEGESVPLAWAIEATRRKKS